MLDTLLKAIKDGAMPSNASGKDSSPGEKVFNTESRGGLSPARVEPERPARVEPERPARVEPERQAREVPREDTTAGRQLSVLGPSVTFIGSLSAEEDLLIQGRVEGSIAHNATNLTIGPRGDVEADIVGHRVIIQGKLQGDVRASELVIVEASAQVHGNIFAPSVALRDGARFKGNIDMEAGAEGLGENTVNELLTERAHG